MSPGEHALSQRVLEFLIAHQDWFILDIPPPPRNHPGLSAPGSVVGPDGVTDEEPSHIGGAWKLIEKDRPMLPRRRTTMEHSGIYYYSDFCFVEY